MDTLAAIGRWLAKQHVVTWCVQSPVKTSCGARMPFIFYDPDTVAFYLLSEEQTAMAR